MSPRDIESVLARLDNQDAALHRIEAKVTETNGRVKSLELWKARLEGAKEASAWLPPAIVSVGVGVIVGVLVALLT